MKILQLVLLFFLLLIPYLSNAQGATCATADPFCTSSGDTFPASTSTTAQGGPNYGCLGSQPNPAWYYLLISQAGNLDITLSNSSNVDIDFIAWGPYGSIGAMCNPSNSGIDCSYSTDPTEYLNISNAQVGQYYLVMITNFSGSSTNISAQQTGGGGATDCTIVNPCNITFLDANVSACTAGTFGITGQVQFTNPPTTGTLVVSTCSGDQQTFTAPFNSPINYSIGGIVADGTPGCSVTATFSADGACTNTTGTFTEPVCVCNMDVFNVLISACDGFLNTYSVSGDLSFTTPPTTGSLIVEVDNGITTFTTTVAAPFTSPYVWNIPNIPADGLPITITAYFTDDLPCSISLASTAPGACICNAGAGTFNTSMTGDGQTNFVLCYGDNFTMNYNNDGSPHDFMNFPSDPTPPTYDPGYGFAIFSCPPTVFQPNSFWIDDPCYIGFSQIDPLNPDNYTETNSNGQPNFLGPWVDQTVYYVPVTFYSLVDGIISYYDASGAPCYDMAQTVAVQYLPEITATSVEDCFAGTATFTINGGLPAVDGSNFTASNLQPGTASFGNTTTGNGGTIVINGLQDGDMYSFDIIDANGCPQTFSGGAYVGLPSADAGSDDTNCSFSYVLNATPSFGTGSWSGAGVTFSPANSPTATATVTSAGSYTMTWTENNGNGCISTDDVIVQFSNLGYTDVVVQSNCGNADGSITLTANNGITAYQYSIDGGSTFQASGSFPNLLANTYNIVVQDNIGCQATGTVSIINQSGPVINSVDTIGVLCNGACDGSIAINASGATQFSIDNGVTFQASNVFPNLCVGPYNVVVENGVGCQDISTALITEPPTLIYTTTVTDLLCFQECIGAIDVNAAGGAGPLQYSSDNGVNFTLNNVFSSLCVGNYNVVVQDANGCQATSVETIIEPAPLTNTNTVTNPICSNSCDGVINVIPAGGDGTYFITWSNGQTIPFITNLCSDQYILNITDGNGCTFDTIFTITGPAAAVINSVPVVDESCPGLCDGSLEIIATNTTQYSIDNITFGPSPIFTNLCAGNYTVYAEDAVGCSTTSTAVIGSPQPLVADIAPVSTICIGGTATLISTVGGGTLPYTYLWEDQAGNPLFTTQNVNVSPIIDGIYTLTVTDANGCIITTTILVTVYGPITVLSFGDSPICEGATSNLSAFASGGDGGPYTYTWQGVGVGQNQVVSPVQSTDYTVIVTDGCESPAVSIATTVNVESIPNISFTGIDLEGCSPVDPIFTSNNIPVGSTCLWNFGDGGVSTDCNTPVYTFTQPGVWDVTLTVTSSLGCVTPFTIPNYVSVYDYPVADFSFGPQPTTILNTEIIFVNESIDAVDYNWMFDATGIADQSQDENPVYTFPNDDPGTYEVCLTAVTANTCPDDTCKYVVIEEEFLVYVPNAFSPDGDLLNNVFMPRIKGVNPFNYKLLIFNRWGELIFESSFPSIGWDGYYKGTMSKTDVYVWKLSCEEETSGKNHEYIGHVTLLR